MPRPRGGPTSPKKGSPSRRPSQRRRCRSESCVTRDRVVVAGLSPAIRRTERATKEWPQLSHAPASEAAPSASRPAGGSRAAWRLGAGLGSNHLPVARCPFQRRRGCRAMYAARGRHAWRRSRAEVGGYDRRAYAADAKPMSSMFCGSHRRVASASRTRAASAIEDRHAVADARWARAAGGEAIIRRGHEAAVQRNHHSAITRGLR